MLFARNRIFKRQFQKLEPRMRARVRERIDMLVIDEFNPVLNNHNLGPPYESYRSINITGDWRLVYRRIETDIYYLRAVGTHHQLYGT